MRKFPKVEGGLTTILVYIPQNRAAVLTLIRLGLCGVWRVSSVFQMRMLAVYAWKMGWSNQIKLLKNRKQMHIPLLQRAKGSHAKGSKVGLALSS